MHLSKSNLIIRTTLCIVVLLNVSSISPVFVNNGYCSTEDAVSERIKGVADFLIEKANDNLIALFEDKINRNTLVKRYFPNTSKILTTLNLKVLMLNGDLWKQSVEKDLQSFAEIARNKLKEEGLSIITDKKFNEIEQYQNNIDIKSINSGISEKFIAVCAKLKDGVKTVNIDELKDDESLQIAQLYIKDCIDEIAPLTSTSTTISDKEIAVPAEMSKLCALLKSRLTGVYDSLEYIQKIQGSNDSFSTRTTYALMTIESLDSFKKIIDIESSGYKSFKNFAIFFAQLSDVKKADEAKSILKSFALPAGSFKSKRKDEMRVSISSYLGFGGGSESDKDKLSYSGIVAPVGVEVSWGIKGTSSFSILGSVFDFGAAVNSQLYNTSDKIAVRDIVAPGITFIWGLPNMPLAIGFGGFKVNGLTNNIPNEVRYLGFIAVDMPLFPLY
ncbi:MAG: hypothetical protein ABII64_04325 [Elusimicrobiota bacterium]